MTRFNHLRGRGLAAVVIVTIAAPALPSAADATIELVIVAAAWFRYRSAKTLSSDPADEPDLTEA